MPTSIHRRDLFKLGAAAGAGSLLAAGPAGAVAPEPAPDDFGYLQFGVVAELVSEAFYRRAIADGDWTRAERRQLTTARDGDTRHLRTLNGVVAAQGPVERSDYEIVFPRGTFSSRERILAQGEKLEKLVVGVYMDAVTNAADPGTRGLFARLLTADARHLAGIAELNGESAVTSGLQAATFLEPGGQELDRYLRLLSFPNEGDE